MPAVAAVNADVPFPFRTPVRVVAPVPPFPTGSVPVTAEVKLTPDKVPPRVRLPDEVTVPVSVRPLTVPAPVTEVTVPVLLVKPLGLLAGYAPRADKAAAADVAPVPPWPMDSAVVRPDSDVMSEFAPDPAALRFKRAPEALVAPVPPDAIASVPASVSVPEVVMGEPVNDRPVVPPDAATDVTVPPPAVDVIVMPPALFVMLMPDPAVRVAFVSVLPVLLPMSNCPSV